MSYRVLPEIKAEDVTDSMVLRIDDLEKNYTWRITIAELKKVLQCKA